MWLLDSFEYRETYLFTLRLLLDPSSSRASDTSPNRPPGFVKFVHVADLCGTCFHNAVHATLMMSGWHSQHNSVFKYQYR